MYAYAIVTQVMKKAQTDRYWRIIRLIIYVY